MHRETRNYDAPLVQAEPESPVGVPVHFTHCLVSSFKNLAQLYREKLLLKFWNFILLHCRIFVVIVIFIAIVLKPPIM